MSSLEEMGVSVGGGGTQPDHPVLYVAIKRGFRAGQPQTSYQSRHLSLDGRNLRTHAPARVGLGGALVGVVLDVSAEDFCSGLIGLGSGYDAPVQGGCITCPSWSLQRGDVDDGVECGRGMVLESPPVSLAYPER